MDGYPITVVRSIDWGEMDAMSHVNNVVYFRWFETGRAAYFGAMGGLLDPGPKGTGVILKSVACSYKAPLKWPDTVTIGVRCTKVDVDRFTLEHAVHSSNLGRVVATGDAVMVAYDYDRGEKTPMPSSWRDAIVRIEGRAP